MSEKLYKRVKGSGAGTSEGRDEKDRRASEKERIRRTDCPGQGVSRGL